jgi:hypothetical protein
MKIRNVDLTIKARPEDSSSRDYPINKIVINDGVLNPKLENEGILNVDYEDIFDQIVESIESDDAEERPQLHEVTYPTGKFILWVKVGVARDKKVRFLMGVQIVNGDDGKILVIGEIMNLAGKDA